MINITSKLKREYTISIGERDKLHMYNNIDKILLNSSGGIVAFNIKASNTILEAEELSRLESYGVKMNLDFKNITKTINLNAKEIKKVIEPEIVEKEQQKVMVYKKIIRSGQTEVFKDGIILAENINETGRVESHSGVIVLKKNFGVINVVGGSILIDPAKNYGEIHINGIDITESLMQNEEIKNSNRVLIEKTEEEIKYEIY